jgi:hypothetical protein
MNISNYYWYFQNAIPHKICDEIVQYGKMLKEKEMLALTGGYTKNRDLNKQPLTKKEIKDLKKKRNSNIVWMDDKWIYKEIHPMLILQIKVQVGILNGIGQNLVNLQNIKKVNIMIGIVIVGINLIYHKIKMIQLMVKLENYQ